MKNAMQIYKSIKTRFNLDNIQELDLQLLASEIMCYKRTGMSDGISRLIMNRFFERLGDKKYEYLNKTIDGFNNEIKKSTNFKYLKKRLYFRYRNGEEYETNSS